MFKINDDDDDDDEFWKEFPLETFEVEPVPKTEKRRRSPIPVDFEGNKKHCTLTRNDVSLPGVSTPGTVPNFITPTSLECSTLVPDLQTHPNKGVTLPYTLSPWKQSLQAENSSILMDSSRGNIQESPAIKQLRNTPETNSKRTKRIFPGPAGILPKLVSSDQLEDVVMKLDSVTSNSRKEEPISTIPSSQSQEVFNESPWKKLVSDLGEEASDILKKFSIKEIHRRASKKLLCQGKVLLLFSVLETIDFTNLDASVHLRDKTGSIQGTVHRNLVKEYRDDLHPGSVLVLKHVGVISPTPRTHYLNITTTNLVSIYSVLTSGDINIHWQENNASYPKLVANARLLQNSRTPPSPKGSVINSPTLSPLHPPLPLNPPGCGTPPLRLPYPRTPNSIQHSRVCRPSPLASSTPVILQSPSSICDKPSRPPHHVSNFPRNVNSAPRSVGQVRQNMAVPAILAANVTPAPHQSKSIPLPNSSNKPWTFKSPKTLEPAIKNSCRNTRTNPLLESALSDLRNSSLGKLPGPLSGDKDLNCSPTLPPATDMYRLRPAPCQNGDSLENNEVSAFQDDLWQDDLTDDILSQISEDIF